MKKMTMSPMMRHYLEIKEKYKDCVVFYRLGDFYEMFFDDAVRVSAMLDLTLTGRDCGMEERAPMCGIPYHAADTYVAKLVGMGEKVAICEQLTDPKESKGIVERDVIRVISAGTLIENELLDEKSNNFIASVCLSAEGYALAWADITTGEFYVTDFGPDEADGFADQMVRIAPVEIIGNTAAAEASRSMPIVEHGVVPAFSAYNDWAFSGLQGEKLLKEQLNVLSLAPFGLEGEGKMLASAGALIEYLRETQKHALRNFNDVRRIRRGDFVMLDANAIRNLELVRSQRDSKKYGSLLWLMDRTSTAMGARNLYSWILSPLRDRAQIEYRLDGVDELYRSSLIRESLVEQMKNIKDIERLAGKISNGNVTPRDCETLARSLSAVPNILFQLSGVTSAFLRDVCTGLPDLGDLTKLLTEAIADNPPVSVKEGGFIREGYNADLDELRAIRSSSTSLTSEIERTEREKTGIRNLKVGFNRVFGYYIEVTNSYKDLVPYSYVRKQTVANAERYVTEELKRAEEKILRSEEMGIRLENELFEAIKETLAARISDLKRTARSIAVLDTLVSFASLARERSYCRPEIVASDRPLNVVAGRHPVVEAVSHETFVSNDVLLDCCDNRTVILTGPNMAGKSTYMRQTALIVLMAHIGSFVPAKSADVPLVDRIFTRVGANDNLIFNQSTFLVEMTEVADILRSATEKSLLILDEVGRGTSTYDGLSIAWAVVEYITQRIKAKTLFATHYHELTELEGQLEGVKNYKVTVKEINGTVAFLRKIARGGANRSFGIEVAGLAGVPGEVTARAKSILKKLEKNDLARDHLRSEDAEEEDREPSEVERMLASVDPDSVSPMQALQLLAELKKRLN